MKKYPKSKKVLTSGLLGLSLVSPVVALSCSSATGGHGYAITPMPISATNRTLFDDPNAFSQYAKLSNKVTLSTDPNKPNLIEIFADGLDPLWTQAILGEYQTKNADLKAFDPQLGTYHAYGKDENGAELHESLKDFVSFPNYFTGWVSTLFGKALEFGGREFNMSNISQSVIKANRAEDFETDLWRASSENDAMRMHFLTAKDHFSSATIFSENDTCRPYDSVIDSWGFLSDEQKDELKAINHSDLTERNYGGDGAYAKKLFKDQNLNFYTKNNSLDIIKKSKDPELQAKASEFARDSWATYGAMDITKIDNKQPLGGRLLLQHSVSHTPRETNYDGTLLTSSSGFPDETREAHATVAEMTWRGVAGTAGHLETAHGTAANLTNLRYVVNKLKNLKDTKTGRSAYDNSMIVVFGDHSDHQRADNSYDNLNTAKFQSSSQLLVKFPDSINTTNDYPQIDINHTIWAGDLNLIIQKYFDNKPTNPMDIFQDSTFNLERPLLVGNRDGWDTSLSFGNLNSDNRFIWQGESSQVNSAIDNVMPKKAFHLYDRKPEDIYQELFINNKP